MKVAAKVGDCGLVVYIRAENVGDGKIKVEGMDGGVHESHIWWLEAYLVEARGRLARGWNKNIKCKILDEDTPIK